MLRFLIYIVVGDTAYYTLQLSQNFDIAYKTEQYQNGGGKAGSLPDVEIDSKNAGNCGTKGQIAGLGLTFQSTDLSIPYGTTIEVPLSVTNDMNLCLDFFDIEVMLISTCEIDSANSQVYQYEEAASMSAGAPVLYDQLTGALNSTATFSVHWPPEVPPRLLGD